MARRKDRKLRDADFVVTIGLVVAAGPWVECDADIPRGGLAEVPDDEVGCEVSRG